MIVEITSLAPVAAFRRPAIPAHKPPATAAATIANMMWSTAGIPANEEPIQTATIAPDGVLALAADVEHAGAERERDREADEEQRCGLDQRLLEVARRGRALGSADPREQPVEAGAVEDRLIRRERIVARREHDQAGGDERDDRRDDRHHARR